MGKLIEDVARAIGERFDSWRPSKNCCHQVEGAARAVLNEMFEEREVEYLGHDPNYSARWFEREGTQSGGVRQTILVPRARPEPTLAEAARAYLDYIEYCWGPPASKFKDKADALRAALAREGK